MAHLERFYNILYNGGGKWMLFNDTEYTSREADLEVRALNKTGAQYGMRFRKKFIYECEVEIVSAR